MSKNLTIVLLLLILCVIAAVGFFTIQLDIRTPPVFACTMDALVCPDGSAVGRTGPSCTFAPCPSTGDLVGIFTEDSEGKHLVIAAKEGSQMIGSTTILLVLSDSPALPALIGKQVIVSGAYTEGSIFAVKEIKSTEQQVPSKEEEPSPLVGVSLAPGAGQVIGGIKVTFNNIISDSRCPLDVQCIQAGNIVANVTLQGELDKVTVNISSDAPYMFGPYKISIVNILPIRSSGTNQSPVNYRVSFSVVKLP